MTVTEHRRRAWQALQLGPLWQPRQGALPHAPLHPAGEAAVPGSVADSAADCSPPLDGPMAQPASPLMAGAPAGHQPPAEAPSASGADAVAGQAASMASPALAQQASEAGQAVQATVATAPPGAAAADEAGAAEALPDEIWQALAEEASGWMPAGPVPGEAGSDLPALAGAGPADEPAAEAADMLLSAKSGLSDAARWQQLRAAVADCQRCQLAQSRQNTVFGRGQASHARWMLIGEAPGAEEDRQGEAFVGQAGQLLDAMLRASGIDPASEVFIANVLKCRPPGNRNPEQAEVARCESFLHEQIRLVAPDCILLLGRFAAQSVLNSSQPINRLRGRVHHIALAGRQVPVICTFHPAYLLRSPLEKLKSWEDLCLARSVLGNRPGG